MGFSRNFEAGDGPDRCGLRPRPNPPDDLRGCVRRQAVQTA